MKVPNGSINDPAFVEQTILRDVDWLRLACVMWLNDQRDIVAAYDALELRLAQETLHWQKLRLSRDTPLIPREEHYEDD